MCVHRITNRPDSLGRDTRLELDTEQVHGNCDYVGLEKVVTAGNKDLTVIQLNVRGLQSKVDQLKYLIDHCYQNTTPDVVSLCETWLTPGSPTVAVPGYKFFHRD